MARNRLGLFLHELVIAKNTDMETVASLLRTSTVALRAACHNRLNPTPTVWADRLIEAFALNIAEADFLHTLIRRLNQTSKVKRTWS